MTTHANAVPASPVARRGFDPRVLLVSVILLVAAATATVRTIPAMAGLLLFVVAWHAVAAGRAGQTARALGRVVPFAFVILAINAVLVPGEALLSLAGRRIVSRDGLFDGAFFSLRLAVMWMAMSLLLRAASAESLACGVHDLVRRVSARAAGRLAFFVFLAMGFVPLFADEMARIRMAQSFRGADFSGSIWRRAGSVRAWLVPLLISAVHRSGQLALAVELREIRARLVATLPAPRARLADAVFLLAAIAAVVAASFDR
jgi:energy-coupling factor transport system permease protein